MKETTKVPGALSSPKLLKTYFFDTLNHAMQPLVTAYAL